MGGYLSTVDETGRLHSETIDRQLEKDRKKYQRECRILLLGPGNSGKSSIVKQMKIAHQNCFSPEEREEYRPFIYQNVLDAAQAIVLYMRKTGQQCTQPRNRMLAEKVLDYELEINGSKELYFSSEIACAIDQFHKDSAVQNIIDEHPSEFYLTDNADYFFKHVLRIGSAVYCPNEIDLLMTRRKTFGITEMRFDMGQLSISIFDVGILSGRRKWIHYFETVTSIIFCTALDEYDQVLLEEKQQNRIDESLVLFESVINSRWFLRTSIILFLNKMDVFKHKIIKVPLERHFPEYTGGRDANKAAKYILWKFMQVNRARLDVYPHLTQATDTTHIKLIFAVVKETLVRNVLKDFRLLKLL